MGSGTYSLLNRSFRADTLGYSTKSSTEIFNRKTINSSMNPEGIKIREARDSKEHPNTLAIILALDVTGSMGSIPHHLVKEGLPIIVDDIIKSGILDPQVLFLGIGDHTCDSFPLQVGQFESSDELMDKWLTDLYLEGGGGGNEGESYLLAWYFAGNHTSIDCFEKRKEKGFLFTIGDEPYLNDVSKSSLKGIMGDGQYGNLTALELLNKAQEKYNVYHILIKQGSAGSKEHTYNVWKQLLKDNLIICENHKDVSKFISETIKNTKKKVNNIKENIIL
jgi:hypothetical protein